MSKPTEMQEYYTNLWRKAMLEHYKDDLKAAGYTTNIQIPECPYSEEEIHQRALDSNKVREEKIISPEEKAKMLEEERMEALKEYDKIMDAASHQQHIKYVNDKVQYFKTKEQEIVNEYLESTTKDAALLVMAKTLSSLPHPVPKIVAAVINARGLLSLGENELQLISGSTNLAKEIKQFCNSIQGKNEELIIPIPSICIEE